ncbi:MAG TPA: hypothetical protein VIU13_08680 [Chryseolinea sp.]
MGSIEKDKIIDVLDKFPWTELLLKMDSAKESEIHFSPSIEFENKETRHGVTISIVDPDNFYIFYKRPKLVSKMFGLVNRMEEDFLSDRTEQTINDVREAVNALAANDIKTLEARWG